ncbi:hypothetical protein OTU49_005489 [Cherax quadricarinatus]|uniref:Transmembrane protein n=1 Tax=Cherax quadricarinatus TaxID=27406 RepID=A0AAW0X5V9_CHEQU
MGVGVGKGEDVGVKGMWLVNTFLFLLTGSQEVLLPWTPLILKAAGFSALGVGVATCITTLASSVGVVTCLAGVRWTRSGAVRRLFLLLLLAAAIALQVSAVILQQQGTGERTSLCYHENHLLPASPTSPPLISLSTLRPGSSSSKPSTSPSTSLPKTLSELPTSTMGHKNGSIVILKTTNNMTTMRYPNITTSQKPAITTATTSTTNTSTTADISSMIYNSTTAKETVPFYSHMTVTDDSQIFVTDSTELMPGEDSIGPSVTMTDEGPENKQKTLTFTSPRSTNKLNIYKYNAQKNLIKTTTARGFRDSLENSDQDVDVNYVNDNDTSPEDSESNNGDNYYYDSDNDGHQGDESSLVRNSGSSHHNGIPFHYSLDTLSKPSSQRKSSANVSLTLFGQQRSLQTKFNRLDHIPWNPRSRLNKFPAAPQTNHRSKSGQEDPAMNKDVSLGDTKSRSRQRKSHLGNHILPQVFPSPRLSSGDAERSLSASDLDWDDQQHRSFSELNRPRPSNNKLQSYLSRPVRQAGASGSKYLNGDELKSGIRSHKIPKRTRRSLSFITENMNKDNENNKTASQTSIDDASITKSRTIAQRERIEETGSLPGNYVSGVGVKMGVAILLTIGGFIGSGVEASMAQLWHCYSHGYDEGGVSHDILQRTITHTFHLSTYAAHKTWSRLTSGAWLLGGGVLSIIACMVGLEAGVYGGMASVHLAVGVCALCVLLVVPIPYGSVDPPRTRRPLSLYLDDEVLTEGIRRLTFHAWVLANGCLAAFSFTFGIWLLQEMTPQGSALAAQTWALTLTLISEGLALHAQRWLLSHVGLQGTMGVGGVGIMLHLATMWVASENVNLMVVSHAGLGCGLALMWIAVKNNSLLLATVTDQEREAWASWWCWRLGLSLGAVVWGAGIGKSVRSLLLPATLISAAVASTVGVAAIITRRHWRTRRHIYHTLDLNMANNADEDDDDDPCEDDWLVRRAKKEGITL